MRFEPGQVVGEYQIVAQLGQGGLGAVYEATHLISQRREAMKVMLSDKASTSDSAERFRREIQMLAALDHPNIASLHTAFYFEEQLVMIMELVAGEDLRSRSRRLRIPIPQLIEYAAQVLDALGYAHAHGVVHRDIKPANIMVTPEDRIKLLDFGIALAEQATDLTAPGAPIGSPSYISPEQIRCEKVTAQSDFYSLGVSLYELIAGTLPIKGDTSYDLMAGHIHQAPVPLRSVRPDIPAHLSDVISRALSKTPSKRYSTAAEFLAALRATDAYELTGTLTYSPLQSWQGISTDQRNRRITEGAGGVELEPLVKHLAAFIGPIAKIVVNRLAKQYSTLDQLYAHAALQIENAADREKFLRTRPR